MDRRKSFGRLVTPIILFTHAYHIEHSFKRLDEESGIRGEKVSISLPLPFATRSFIEPRHAVGDSFLSRDRGRTYEEQ